MADRVPISTIPGLVSGLVDQDVLVATFGRKARVSRIFLHRFDQVIGTATGALRTAPSGGGSALAWAFGAGAETAVATGSLTVEAGESLYLRVATSDATSLHLSGWVEVEGAAGVTTALTTLARVKAFRGITSSTEDDLLEEVIAGVSERMQRYMGRRIVVEEHLAELHDGPRCDTLTLQAYPIADPGGVVVRLDGAVVDPSEYVVRAASGQLVAVSGGFSSAWERGRLNYSVDYEAGFAEVPEDLALAATRQAAFLSLESAAGDKGRLGNRGTVLEAGGSREYVTTEWLPGVLATLDSYRERRLA